MNSSKPTNIAANSEQISQSSPSNQAVPESPATDNKAAEQVKKINELNELKANFICPLSRSIFLKPAQLDCGNEHFVEEELGKKLLKEAKPCCPTCREPITKVSPSRNMKVVVDNFLSAHPEFKNERYEPEPEVQESKVTAVQPSSPHSASPDPFAPSLSAEEIQQQQQEYWVLQQTANAAREQPNNRANGVVQQPYNQINGYVPPAPVRNRINGAAEALPANRSALVDSRSPSTHSMFANRANNPAKRFQILVIGDRSAGKGKLIERVVNNPISDTSGVTFDATTMTVNNVDCRLQFWCLNDTRFLADSGKNIYRSGNAIIMMYNIGNAESFANIKNYKSECDSMASSNATIFLVGNDTGGAESKRVVTTQQGQALANELGVKFFECSTRNNLNVTEIFNSLCTDVLAKEAAANQSNASQPGSGRKPDGGKCTIM